MMKIEVRNGAVHIEGYVNVVERDSRVLLSPTRGKFVEQVRAKTFQRALEATKNVDLLFNHNPHRKLGSTQDGTIKLWEDNIGLRALAVITDAEIVAKANNNELKGWSFAFEKIKDDWNYGSDGVQRRFLEEITLPEVSILDVTPAYIATSLEVRSEVTQSSLEYRTSDSSSIEVSQDEYHVEHQLTSFEIELMKLR